MRDLILLFRGVNVGGHRKLPMADLRSHLASAGYANPRSYIQSGNVIVGTDTAPSAVVEQVQGLIQTNFGFSPDIMTLTRSELAKAVEDCPFAMPDADPSRVHLFFHIGKAISLDGLEVPPAENARIAAGQLAHYLDTPEGMSKSKLAEMVTRRLKDKATARNLRTCQKILELAQ